MKMLYWIMIALAICTGCSSKEEKEKDDNITETGQITLYDKEKKAIAYIDYGDENTIYLWDGTPVAYLVSENKTVQGNEIFGFNGICLGWYYDGVLYGQDGYAVGAEKNVAKGQINMVITYVEQPKGVKYIKPIKHIREISPVQHVYINKWSDTDLTEFLKQGIKNE